MIGGGEFWVIIDTALLLPVLVATYKAIQDAFRVPWSIGRGSRKLLSPHPGIEPELTP